MKKILLSIVVMMTVIVAAFSAGCSANAYDGNYVEATPEQRDAALRKLEDLSTVNDDEHNYELTCGFDIATSDASNEVTMKGNMYALEDNSDKNAPKAYFSIDLTYAVTANKKTETVAVKMNYYLDGKSNKIYLDYTLTESRKGYSSSISQQKVSSMKEVSNLVGEYMALLTQSSGTSVDMGVSDFLDFFDAPNTVFYVDGDSKFKWVQNVSENSKMEMYFIANDNGTYQAKVNADIHLIVVSASSEGANEVLSVTENLEVVPTDKKVTLPDKSNYVE